MREQENKFPRIYGRGCEKAKFILRGISQLDSESKYKIFCTKKLIFHSNKIFFCYVFSIFV